MNAFTDHSRQQHFHSFESASRDELIHRYAELRRGELRCVYFQGAHLFVTKRAPNCAAANQRYKFSAKAAVRPLPFSLTRSSFCRFCGRIGELCVPVGASTLYNAS